MYLQKQQIDTYNESGFLLVNNLFSDNWIKEITHKLSSMSWEDKPGTVLESDRKTIRGIHEDPTKAGLLEKISKHSCIVNPAMQLLGSPVYIHQLKINFKASFSGDFWPWHQDYIYWKREDGMPTARAINIVIFLEEVNEFNGPLYLIPGSHKQGIISSLSHTETDSADPEAPEWISSFKSDLKYTTPEETVSKLVAKFGIEAPKGQRGSVLFFHPNCVHASANNISPFPRKIAIITYNSVENIPIALENKRPDFLVGRDYINTIAQKTKPLKNLPTVVALEWTEPLMGGGNWIPELLEIAGGKPILGVKGEHSPYLSWDSLAEADPDVIIIMPCGFDLERTKKESRILMQHSHWSNLKAVKNGEVFLVDGNAYFNRLGPRLVDSAEILAEILHPQLFNFGYRGKSWQPFF